MSRRRTPGAVAVLLATVFLTSAFAVGWRAAVARHVAPEGTWDRTALRHVGPNGRERTKKQARSIDPRSDDEREIDKLDARIRLMWAKVERIETEVLRNLDNRREVTSA